MCCQILALLILTLKCAILWLILKTKSGLGIIHLNMRSTECFLYVDSLRIWAKSTDADIIILSETWLSKSVTDKDFVISEYNVFRTDWPRKAGGVTIYVKNKFTASVLLSISVSKQLEFVQRYDYHCCWMLQTNFCCSW